MAAECAGIVYNSPCEGYGFAEAVLPADGTTALVWQPLIPIGDFDHPDFGPFSVTYEDMAAMEANFRAGLPVSRGIPIDEDGLHGLRGEGAYGWVRDVRIQDGWLEGGIEWTPAGVAAVSSGELPYVSAHFFPHGCEAPEPWGRDNFILSVALCTRPFFNDQPELRVAAPSYKRVGPGVRAAVPISNAKWDGHRSDFARSCYLIQAEKWEDCKLPVYEPDTNSQKVDGHYTKRGALNRNAVRSAWDALGGARTGQPMAVPESVHAEVRRLAKLCDIEVKATMANDNDLQARLDEALGKVGTLNDQLAALTTERDGLKASVDTLTEERDGLKASVATLTEQCDGYKLSIENLQQRVGEMEETTALAAAEKDIAATALAKGQQLAPAAVGLMATARVKPTPENLRALQDHLMENGGALLTVPLPDKDKGLTATAPVSDEAMSDEEWLAAKPITEAAKAKVRQIMQSKSLKASVAYREYLRSKS